MRDRVTRRVDALAERVEVLPAVRVEQHDLAVEHVAARREAELGEVARERPPVARLQVTSSPSTKAMARKPSHLGSYTQPGPVGSALADLASWGGSGGDRGRAMAARCYPAVREYYDRRAAGVRRVVPRHGALRRARAARLGGGAGRAVRGARARCRRRARSTSRAAPGSSRATCRARCRRWTRACACSPSPRPRLPGGRVVQGDALALPFADGAFERVAAGHFYGHLEPAERARFLAEAGRVGRRAGGHGLGAPARRAGASAGIRAC